MTFKHSNDEVNVLELVFRSTVNGVAKSHSIRIPDPVDLKPKDIAVYMDKLVALKAFTPLIGAESVGARYIKTTQQVMYDKDTVE